MVATTSPAPCRAAPGPPRRVRRPEQPGEGERRPFPVLFVKIKCVRDASARPRAHASWNVPLRDAFGGPSEEAGLGWEGSSCAPATAYACAPFPEDSRRRRIMPVTAPLQRRSCTVSPRSTFSSSRVRTPCPGAAKLHALQATQPQIALEVRSHSRRTQRRRVPSSARSSRTTASTRSSPAAALNCRRQTPSPRSPDTQTNWKGFPFGRLTCREIGFNAPITGYSPQMPPAAQPGPPSARRLQDRRCQRIQEVADLREQRREQAKQRQQSRGRHLKP